jgi:two-component system alkaline phosphatase synthesis response regulator PhoP
MAQRILVVDDDKSIVKVLVGYLEQSGYQTIAAYDGDSALHALRRERPDLILLDLMMPNRDGWELLQALRADPTTSPIPVIVCSVLEDPDLALSLGAQAYLKKPIGAVDLLQALAAQVANKAGF